MIKKQLLKVAAVSIGCLGVMAQPNMVSAAGPNVKATKTDNVKTQDIALNKDGVLRGFVVDAQGKPLDAAQVVLKQGRFEVSKTLTAKDGSFEVANLKNGTYIVETAQGQAVIRVWAERVAPPAAKSTLVVVSDADVVRGQLLGTGLLGFGTTTSTLVTVGVVGGVVAGTVGVVNSAEAQDDADEANNRANQLQQTVNEQQQRITTLESSN